MPVTTVVIDTAGSILTRVQGAPSTLYVVPAGDHRIVHRHLHHAHECWSGCLNAEPARTFMTVADVRILRRALAAETLHGRDKPRLDVVSVCGVGFADADAARALASAVAEFCDDSQLGCVQLECAPHVDAFLGQVRATLKRENFAVMVRIGASTHIRELGRVVNMAHLRANLLVGERVSAEGLRGALAEVDTPLISAHSGLERFVRALPGDVVLLGRMCDVTPEVMQVHAPRMRLLTLAGCATLRLPPDAHFPELRVIRIFRAPATLRMVRALLAASPRLEHVAVDMDRLRASDLVRALRETGRAATVREIYMRDLVAFESDAHAEELARHFPKLEAVSFPDATACITALRVLQVRSELDFERQRTPVFVCRAACASFESLADVRNAALRVRFFEKRMFITCTCKPSDRVKRLLDDITLARAAVLAAFGLPLALACVRERELKRRRTDAPLSRLADRDGDHAVAARVLQWLLPGVPL